MSKNSGHKTKMGFCQQTGSALRRTTVEEQKDDIPILHSILSPAEYFNFFFYDILMQHIVQQTNLYAVQQNPAKPLHLTCLELAQFLSILLCMSIICLPQLRLHWSKNIKTSKINSIIFFLYFLNILSLYLSSDEGANT